MKQSHTLMVAFSLLGALPVFGQAPIITQIPQNLWAYEGQNPSLQVSATGTPAPEYQWRFESNPLPGETNALLTLVSASPDQTGVYSVTVSNSFGSTNVFVLLIITPKPRLVITEVMSNPATNGSGSTLGHGDWWELTNLDQFQVNLNGYRFDNGSDNLGSAFILTSDIAIRPGESIVFAQDMTAQAFRDWWGPRNLPAELQIITYPGGGLNFDATGDELNLWNAAADSNPDKVDAVAFASAAPGVSFVYNPENVVSGSLSTSAANGVLGAFTSAILGDAGSPGFVVETQRIDNIAASPDGIAISWNSFADRQYSLQYKPALTSFGWATLTNLTATGATTTATDPIISTQRVYRLLLGL